jgi:membrane associated rhomboid family serine protease
MAFLQGSPPSRAPFLNAPGVVLGLIGIFLAAHVARISLPGDWPDRIVEDFAVIPARYADTFALGWSFGDVPALLLPLVTYVFLHGDFTHVGINSLWLLAVGAVVARRLGALKFLLFFFFCGIAAALLHLAVYWGSPGAVIGASGGVSGLMGAAMRIVYGRIYAYPDERAPLAPLLSQRILTFTAVWTGINVVSGVLRLGVSDDLTLIAWVAHLGGYFAGLLAIGPFDRTRQTALTET